MDLDYLGADLELKTVNIEQRIISGYAAYHHNRDRMGDIVDPAASVKAVGRLKAPSDVAVFVAHNSAALPIGIPLKIEATPQGLYTETYILKGSAGDNLLAVAKDLMDHGQSLGQSIGYKTRDSRREQTVHGMARRLLDYSLKEYSYAASQAIANPLALVSAVKSRRRHKALSEGSDASGGALVPAGQPTQARGKEKSMQYRVERRGTQYLVYADADADGDEDDNQLVGSYDSEEMASAVVVALRTRERAAQSLDTDDDDGDPPPEVVADKTLSLLHQPMTEAQYRRLSDSQKMALHAELMEVGVL